MVAEAGGVEGFRGGCNHYFRHTHGVHAMAVGVKEEVSCVGDLGFPYKQVINATGTLYIVASSHRSPQDKTYQLLLMTPVYQSDGSTYQKLKVVDGCEAWLV